jgi:hypothetical protein
LHSLALGQQTLRPGPRVLLSRQPLYLTPPLLLLQVGFGDVLPGNASEKIYAMFAMILGTTVFAYSMSSMGQLIGTLNAAGAQAAAKFKVRVRGQVLGVV